MYLYNHRVSSAVLRVCAAQAAVILLFLRLYFVAFVVVILCFFVLHCVHKLYAVLIFVNSIRSQNLQLFAGVFYQFYH